MTTPEDKTKCSWSLIHVFTNSPDSRNAKVWTIGNDYKSIQKSQYYSQINGFCLKNICPPGRPLSGQFDP